MFSCQKDIKDVAPEQPAGNNKAMGNVKAPPDFNWKTSQSVELVLNSSARSSLIVKSATGIVFQKAILNGKDTYKSGISVPAYIKELTFIVNGTSYVLKIENNRVVHSF